jgi:hypothetical protein
LRRVGRIAASDGPDEPENQHPGARPHDGRVYLSPAELPARIRTRLTSRRGV